MARDGRYLALLRGINVGGNNIIPKDDLRSCFEALGFERVRTYIQSGNVLFRSDETNVGDLTAAIEGALSSRFSYPAQAVVLSRRRYASAVRAAPEGWGTDDSMRHNALFTLRGITPRRVLSQLPEPKAEIEAVAVGTGVLFWSAAKAHVTRATMSRLPGSPVYRHVTIRNHNTVYKLLELFDEL